MSSNTGENNFVEQLDGKPYTKKYGRTLLFVPSNNNVDMSVFNNLSGVLSTYKTKSGSYFLTFDTVESSYQAFQTFKDDQSFRVKFARYQIFFTLNGMTDTSDYNSIKQEMTSFIEKEASGQVLYFKLYRKNNKFINCGDLTVDSLDAMNKLINKQSQLKTFTLGSLTGKFYKYNRNSDNNMTANH